jgi:3'-5' exoribonuclease
MAYIITDQGINCHGYEVVEDRPELDWSKLPPHKELIVRNDIDEQYYRRLLKYFINRITNEPLRLFVSNILEKNSNRFYIWPAAHGVHHNYPNGLLQHTCNVVKNAYSIASNYNDVDMDLVLVGAILHDIGKIYEYDEKGDISGEGKLFDHINIGTRMIFEEYYHGQDSVYSFSERDVYNIAHIILSHHGKLEWGSPRQPATQEAMIVHYADYIDTNMFIAHKELLPLDIDNSVKSFYNNNATLVQTKFSMNPDYDRKLDFI